jgi:D-glycero-beta-D-manno-heptose-7-phosphate kinase
VTDLRRLRGATVLAVGDLMLDEYVWGDVQRISPEAPVPVVDVRRRSHAPGGAANVAAGVAALEGRALLGGAVGEDPAAAAVRDAVEASGVDAGGVVVDPQRPTTTKTRVIAHAQQVVRTDFEARAPLPRGVEAELLEWVRRRLPEADAAVLSDYRKGVVTPGLAQGVIGIAHQAGKPVVVDPKGLDYAAYRGATVLTPNAHDAGQAANVHIETDDDLMKAAGRLSELCDDAALLITRGAAGMTLIASNGRVEVPAEARAVYDVTGAGDTVVAVLAVALGRGVPLAEAVGLANTAAGIVVGKVGTSTVTLDELEERLA